MRTPGVKFYVTDNGVWLTDQMPPEFLDTSIKQADSAMTSRQPELCGKVGDDGLR